MELSDFLLQKKPNVRFDFKSVDQRLIDEEEQLFNEFFKDYPESEYEDIRDRLKYIRPYIINYPDYDEKDFFLSEEAFNHYRWREQKMAETCLSEKEFYNFKEIQESIASLGLELKPTFEFILYLWHVLRNWLYKGMNERLDERINRMWNKMQEDPEINISADFKVGKNHFKFDNKDFLRAMIANYKNSNIVAGDLVEKIYPKKREIDYLLLRTLLTYLPIKQKTPKKGTFSQVERTFGLCVLWLIGSINHKKNDDPSIYCSHDSNAIFDKLMRDYAEVELIPIISGL